MRNHSAYSRGLRAGCLLAGFAASGPVFAGMPAPGCCFSGCPDPDPPALQRVGDPAGDIQGIDASGTSIRLSQFRGKVILLDVSTMWCGVCQQSAPALEYLHQVHGPRGLVVVTCLAEDSNGAPVTQAGLQQWVATYHLTYPVMNDPSGTRDGVAEQAYAGATGGFPTLALIDKGFKVQSLESGFDLATVAPRIEGLLAQ
ncbi:MAG: TlpA disulfide reductase family protein [Holophaga sp.]|jgi:thiol-disulfide isomerase/thioredoxin